jgi:hypothetical protein
MRASPLTFIMVIAPCLAALAGCYEDTGVAQPQAQQPQPVAGQNEGPISSVGQSSGSALGGAKRSATNIVDRAEQKSREVGEAADEIANPDD